MACTLCLQNHPRAIVNVTTPQGVQGPFKAGYCAALGGWLVNPHNEAFGVKEMFFPSSAVSVVEQEFIGAAGGGGGGENEVMRVGE